MSTEPQCPAVRRQRRLSRVMTCLSLALEACAGVCVPPGVQAQGVEYLKAHYTKQEYQVPMRDGVKLFTAVYSPKDVGQTYPMLLIRTQSGVRPYGGDQFPNDVGPSALFPKQGYIFVNQDIRGRWMSEGTFVNMRPHIPVKRGPQDVDESSDTYDTVDWLLKNVSDHNGNVGLYGTSYRGFYVAMGMIDAHPAIKAATPQAPIADWFLGDDWHHNGALFLSHAFFYLPLIGRPRPTPFQTFPWPAFNFGTPDAYDFYLRLGALSNADARYFHGSVPYWSEMLQHRTYDDYWKARDLRPHLKNIKPAVLTVGGWFDAENLFGALQTYHRIEASSPGAKNMLVMGPWIHGGWNSGQGDGSTLGAVSFGSPTADIYRAEIELPFFEYHLKGKGTLKLPEARVFETGTNRWRDETTWPPRETEPITFYFREHRRLSTGAPEQAGEDRAFDEYVSDPAKPVPYYDKVGIRMLPDYMVSDQRFAASRPDVLVYETEPLEDDLTLAGPIQADLFISSTGTDADWVVKVIDVYPGDHPDPTPNPTGTRLGGYQQLVRGEVMPARFRNSFERPEPLTPGVPTHVAFKLPDVCHTFRKGHKLMVQVQSTWFPLVARNPQTFVDLATAKDTDFQRATHRLYRSAERPSKMVLSRRK